MPWSILHRYVFWELLRVFLLALVAITGILVMAGVVQEASQQGLGPEHIFRLVLFLLPSFLPYTVPATMLFAVSLVYGRLAHDNEITAIKSAGIPVTHVLWPALFMGAAVSAGVLVLYREFIPRSHHQLRTAFLRDIEDLIYSRLRRDLSFREMKMDYAIWVKEVRGRRLIAPIFIKRDGRGKDEIIATAREAELKVDLEQGDIHVRMLHGEWSKDHGNSYLSFEEEIIPVQLPPLGAGRKVRAREMTIAQILQRRQELVDEAEENRRQIALLPNPEHSRVVPPPPGTVAEALHYKLEAIEKEINELNTERAMRPALSFGCLFFVLVGCPVGIWFHKRDYLSAFVTCFLPIVVVYYPLLMLGLNLSKAGHSDPLPCMWAGNALLGATGLLLLSQLLRR